MSKSLVLPPLGFASVTLAVLLLCRSLSFADVQVGFDDLPLSPNTAVKAAGSDTTFTSSGATFNQEWNEQFDCCASAWFYSNQKVLDTPGLLGDASAFVPGGGGALGTNNFAVANNSFEGHATVSLPYAAQVQGAYFANNTYAYLAVVDGDDGAGFVKPGGFTDGDWFKLQIIGKDTGGGETGRVDFFLADYRDGKSEAVDQWTWVDLTSLGSGVKSLEFALSSTDNGSFGMNTPAYFAMDELTVASVPEPSAVLLIVLGIGIVAAAIRRRRAHAAG